MGTQPVTLEHLAAIAATFRDLGDPGIYAGCLEVTDWLIDTSALANRQRS